MRKLLIIFLLFPFVCFGQRPAVYKIVADTVRIFATDGTGAELTLQNDTRDSLGVLTNYANGATQFRNLRLQQVNDSSFKLLLGTTQQGQQITIRNTGSGGSGVTYTLTKKGDSIVLTGSNGSRGAVRDSIGFYSVRAGVGLVRVNDSTLRADTTTLATRAYVDGHGSGGGDSIFRVRLWKDLYNEKGAGTLVKGSKYKITDFATVYEQTRVNSCVSTTVSNITGSTEQLVLTAVNSSDFDPVVQSLSYPKDVIKYDIGYTATLANSVPAKGKIYYRQDSTGNTAYYDFRTIQAWSTSDATAYPVFNAESWTNDLSFNTELSTFNSYEEYPNVIFFGNALFNSKNLIWGGGTQLPNGDCITATEFHGFFAQNSNNWITNSLFLGDVVQNTTLEIGNSVFGGSLQITQNSEITGSYFMSNVVQNSTMTITNSTFTGSVQMCEDLAVTGCTFGSTVNKAINSNFLNTSVGGQIDRLVNCAVLTDTLAGKLYWCQSLFIYNSGVEGDLNGVNQIAIGHTHINCNIENVTGTAQQNSNGGFVSCNIIGSSVSSTFNNIQVNCIVNGKTIDEASYPILFNTDISKTIFKGSDSKIYFSYYNGATLVITEII